MRQHRAPDTVSNSKHAFDVRPALLVDLDEAAIIGRYTCVVRKKTVGKRSASYGNDEFLDVNRLCTILVFIRDFNAFGRGFRRCDFCAKPNIQPLFLEVPLSVFRQFLVGENQKVVHRFKYDDVRPQSVPNAAQLEADYTGADHTERLRHFRKLQRAPGIDNALAVERCDRQLNRRRS